LEKKPKDKKAKHQYSPLRKKKRKKRKSYGRVTTKQKHMGLKNTHALYFLKKKNL